MGLYGLGCIPVYGPIRYMGLYRPVHRPYIGDMGLYRYIQPGYRPVHPYIAVYAHTGPYPYMAI